MGSGVQIPSPALNGGYMKVTFLGTNGWYATHTGNTSCILIDCKRCYVVLDAGDGIHKLDEHIKEDKPIHLFLSHMHLDHIIGFHIFNKFHFRQKLTIYGEKGASELIKNIIRHPYTVPLEDVGMDIEIVDLSEGNHSTPFEFECRRLLHSDSVLGYRMKLDNKVITYCTDTGPCDNILKLSKDADLLITECSLKTGMDMLEEHKKWPHMTPELAANAARRANAGKLVLFHFDASVYRSLKERKKAEDEARMIFENTVASEDGMQIDV